MSNPPEEILQPNVLIIHTDEHNFRTLGCYRKILSPKQAFIWGEGNVVETPHIDAIADQGALCSNFYASSPVCTPSRASFVSGLYPHEAGAYQNGLPLKNDVLSFASHLKMQGYTTGYAGKWHLDGSGEPQWQPERDFGFSDNRFMYNRGHWKRIVDTEEGPQTFRGRQAEQAKIATEGSFTTDWLANRAIDFIDEHHYKPFCYMLSIPDPHGPDTVRSPYHKMYAHLKFKKPHTAFKTGDDIPSWAVPDGLTGDDAAYFGMVKCIDDNVGRIMKALRENNLEDNTIVVFTSDHGDMRGEHARQEKCIPLEASAKVPFVIQWPGRIKGGLRIDESLSCVDFLPTLLGMMGLSVDPKVSGRNASGFFLGEPEKAWADVSILREGIKEGWVCAVDKRYKLVLSQHDDPWLMDKEDDPDELINFAKDKNYRQAVERLGQALLNYQREHQDPALETTKMKNDLAWAT